MKDPMTPAKETTVTITGISSKIKEVKYTTVPDTTTTLCLVYMRNGFLVIGKSACVDKTKFNVALGEKYAYEDALSKLWELEGYLLAESLNNKE